MSNRAKKYSENRRAPNGLELLVNDLDGNKSERRWYWEYLKSILQSPDMDLSQFEQLENKRTPQGMKRNGLY